mmetsp:Transcript_4509/g.10898  ORF Transcript_4509/g.10898 Transcript_4509/m.10898 type:complete len:586 (-) Transcript_4509:376-2133(-)
MGIFFKFSILLPCVPSQNALRWNKQLVFFDDGLGSVFLIRSDSVTAGGNGPEPVAECRHCIAGDVLHRFRDTLLTGVCHPNQCSKTVGGVGHWNKICWFVAQVLERVQSGQFLLGVFGVAGRSAHHGQEVVDRGKLLSAGLVLREILETVARVLSGFIVIGVQGENDCGHDFLHLEHQNLGVLAVTRQIGQEFQSNVLGRTFLKLRDSNKCADKEGMSSKNVFIVLFLYQMTEHRKDVCSTTVQKWIGIAVVSVRHFGYLVRHDWIFRHGLLGALLGNLIRPRLINITFDTVTEDGSFFGRGVTILGFDNRGNGIDQTWNLSHDQSVFLTLAQLSQDRRGASSGFSIVLLDDANQGCHQLGAVEDWELVGFGLCHVHEARKGTFAGFKEFSSNDGIGKFLLEGGRTGVFQDRCQGGKNSHRPANIDAVRCICGQDLESTACVFAANHIMAIKEAILWAHNGFHEFCQVFGGILHSNLDGSQMSFCLFGEQMLNKRVLASGSHGFNGIVDGFASHAFQSHEFRGRTRKWACLLSLDVAIVGTKMNVGAFCRKNVGNLGRTAVALVGGCQDGNNSGSRILVKDFVSI